MRGHTRFRRRAKAAAIDRKGEGAIWALHVSFTDHVGIHHAGVNELVAFARANPEQVTYASAGRGSASTSPWR